MPSARIEKSICEHLARRLRERRLNHGWTQEAVGKSMGIQSQTVNAYEKERRIPSAFRVALFAMLFGCSTDYLFGLDNEIKRP